MKMSVGMLAVFGVVAISSMAMAAEEKQFIGCRPSVGECMMSCSDGRAFAVVGAPECEDAPFEPVACYCLFDTQGNDEAK